MILVETSVMVDFLRKDAKLVRLFPTLTLATCGIVRAELLSDVRAANMKQSVYRALRPMALLPIAESDWDYFGDIRSYLGSKAYSMQLPDIGIACLALLNGIELWSRDKHHARMQAIVPQLRLFQEPP